MTTLIGILESWHVLDSPNKHNSVSGRVYPIKTHSYRPNP